MKRYRDNRRDRFLSPAELGRLGDVLSDLEKDGGDPRHIAILRLLALTGARKTVRWSELDLERGLLRLRDSKTGPKIIRLGIAALELVAALKPNGSVYLFPDRRRPDQPIANLDWAWVCIQKSGARRCSHPRPAPQLRERGSGVRPFKGRTLAIPGGVWGGRSQAHQGRYPHHVSVRHSPHSHRALLVLRLKLSRQDARSGLVGPLIVTAGL